LSAFVRFRAPLSNNDDIIFGYESAFLPPPKVPITGALDFVANKNQSN
jgi:hypothetical protein